MYFTISTRKIIITRSLLPFLREAMSEQYWTIFIKDIEKITFLYWFFLEITYFIDKFKEKKYTLFIRILSIFTQKVQRGNFMKAKILLCSMLILGSLSYAAEADSVAQEVMSEVKNIEAEYQALMQKEAERKEEFRQEKETLEKEVQELKERQLGREELYAKLKEDSKVRWHRDEYKKLLKRFDEYYNKLEQKIADKEQQIAELTKLLEVLN